MFLFIVACHTQIIVQDSLAFTKEQLPPMICILLLDFLFWNWFLTKLEFKEIHLKSLHFWCMVKVVVLQQAVPVVLSHIISGM